MASFQNKTAQTLQKKKVDMYIVDSTMEDASVVVFPFVQYELVAPLVVDGSPDGM